MTSLRGKGSLAKHSVILILLLLFPRALSAQDSLPRPGDTTAARRDTTQLPGNPTAGARDTTPQAGQSGMRPDSLRPDTLRRDTLRRDTLRRDTLTPGPALVPAPAPAPVDSALALACRESSGAPPDLLTVTFRSSATAAEREAVARQVSGTLLGPSEHQEPGSWYLHVPGSGMNPTVADRLIRLPPVVQVGATRCSS